MSTGEDLVYTYSLDAGMCEEVTMLVAVANDGTLIGTSLPVDTNIISDDQPETNIKPNPSGDSITILDPDAISLHGRVYEDVNTNNDYDA